VSDNEAKVLAKALQGDEEAFTQLVESHQTHVYNLCYRMLGNAQEAEEATQESFWRAHQAIRKYDPQRSFTTWLLSIAAHYCIDQHRKRHLELFDLDALPGEIFPDTSPDPEHVMIQNEEEEFVQNNLAKLDTQDRAVIILRYWYDLSEKEIGDMLSISVSAVKSRLFRARKELARNWNAPQLEGAQKGGKRYESPAF
jgi:RNA polymerase sigma-70 factor, ECF subfamily